MSIFERRWKIRGILAHLLVIFFFFFFNDTATTEIYTLSLHDALPISLTRWNLKKVLALNELEYACAWIADYLRTNIDVAESDRTLCEGIQAD